MVPASAVPAETMPRLAPDFAARVFRLKIASDAKLVASKLARFAAAITWEGNDALALALGWSDSADGGRRRVQRALDELERAGLIRRFSPKAFWAWFRAEGAALGMVPPRPAKCPRRFLVFFEAGQAPAVAPRTRAARGPLPATAEGIAAAIAALEHDSSVMFAEAIGECQPDPTVAPMSCSNMTAPSCAKSFDLETESTSEEWSGAIRDDAPRTDGTGFGSASGGDAFDNLPPHLRGAFAKAFAEAVPGSPALPERTPPPQGLPLPSTGRRPAHPAKPLTDSDRALDRAARAIEALADGADPAEVRAVAAELAADIGEPSPGVSVGFWAETIGLALAGVLGRRQLTDVLRGLIGDGGKPYLAISKRWGNLRRTLGLAPYVSLR